MAGNSKPGAKSSIVENYQEFQIMHYKLTEGSDAVGSFADKKTYSLPGNEGSLGFSDSNGPENPVSKMMDTITEEKSR